MLVLIEKRLDNTIVEYALEDLGTVRFIPGAVYTILNTDTGHIYEGIIVNQNGTGLEIHFPVDFLGDFPVYSALEIPPVPEAPLVADISAPDAPSIPDAPATADPPSAPEVYFPPSAPLATDSMTLEGSFDSLPPGLNYNELQDLNGKPSVEPDASPPWQGSAGSSNPEWMGASGMEGLGTDTTPSQAGDPIYANAPTITISNIDISDDTGSSATDFNTRTEAQTITATLSTALDPTVV
ncbi:MAG: hypothetical protein GY860_15810, partial [Desulfobacteraceae bacterium]|nr:hypothetical protein [Desulfobacteraceae bacterium]